MGLNRKFLTTFSILLLFSALGFAVMGYHPGAEDDGIYLSAVKQAVQPSLYPHNANFFHLQVEATLFDEWTGAFIRATGLSVAWGVLLMQWAAIFFTLLGCLLIVKKLFPKQPAQWAGVATVSALFTLPVAGTALYLFDQHLHPRNLATALILLAVASILGKRRWLAIPLLALSFAMHPIMAAMGVAFCLVLVLALTDSVYDWVCRRRAAGVGAAAAILLPGSWLFEPPNPIWKQAVSTRTYLLLYHWEWYEWLGALAPLVLFWILWRWAEKHSRPQLARFSLAIFIYGVFLQAVAMLMLGIPQLVRLAPLQPMRYLQLVYVFLCLIFGALAGEYLLKTKIWRWALFLAVLNVSMFAAQRDQFSHSEHVELPGTASANPWMQAFAWVRTHTPQNAYFALDPRYLAARGNDTHSFRALAERSQFADSIKDPAVITQVPRLGPVWFEQNQALQGWQHFTLTDFERLKSGFGVDWVLTSDPAAAGLQCQWHNGTLSVCKIP